MSTPLWPWLAVAAAGALHGANPCSGWAIAIALAGRGRGRGDGTDPQRVWRSIGPLVAGHVLGMVVVAAGVALGVPSTGRVLATIAGLTLAVRLLHAAWRARGGARAPVIAVGNREANTDAVARTTAAAPPPRALPLALWTCTVSALQGTGLMLVPAFVPVCLSGGPARALTASGSVTLVLGAALVHTAAMIAGLSMSLALAHAGLRHCTLTRPPGLRAGPASVKLDA